MLISSGKFLLFSSSDSQESSCSFFLLFVYLEGVRIFKVAGKSVLSVPITFAALV